MLPVFIFSTLCCVACTRQIKEIADIPPVAVDWGTALDISKLPTTVPVVYANGKTGQASVAWDTAAVPKPVHWSFQLRGLVQGTDLLARILVTVNDSVKTAGLPRLAPWELNSSDAAEFMELHVLPTDVAREVRLAWSPDEQDMVFTAGSSVYVWSLGEEQPRQIALLEGKGAAGGLHHPAWSYDKQYLIVHDGPGIMGDVVVLSYPEGLSADFIGLVAGLLVT